MVAYLHLGLHLREGWVCLEQAQGKGKQGEGGGEEEKAVGVGGAAVSTKQSVRIPLVTKSANFGKRWKENSGERGESEG